MSQEQKTFSLTPELLCTNIKTSVAFYREVLGFGILYQREEKGFAMMERKGVRIMLDELVPGSARSWIAASLEPPFGRGMNLEIGTDKIDELYAHIQSKGISLYMPLEDQWYRADDIDVGVRQFIVQDPDGYLLRFSENMGTHKTKG